MIAENSPLRCPTCAGIHVGQSCPVLGLEAWRISDEDDRRAREFLDRYTAIARHERKLNRSRTRMDA